MREEIRKFFRDVLYTTGVSYMLISFAVMGMLTLFADPDGGGFRSGFQAFSYLLGKLFCVFLFSLGLGFINRIFMLKKHKALLRLAHFFIALVWYVITMVVLYLGFFDMSEGLSVRGAVGNILLYLILYPVCVGISALLRTLFTPKSEKKYKSILD